MKNDTRQFVKKFLASYPDLGSQPQDSLVASDFSLQNMQVLVSALGHPEQDYPSLHIAGTNGKGSVSALCAAALKAQGYKVGLYTSPHLEGPFEGIRIDEEVISSDWAAKLLEQMRPHLDLVSGITRFELLTALALLHFSLRGIDVAVIEVGLGGSLDATNVISPLVSVITPIDLEHQSILGDSLGEIARHKAGIIKRNTPVVLAPQSGEVRKVLHDRAEKVGAQVLEVGRGVYFERDEFNRYGQRISLWSGPGLVNKLNVMLGLHGAHQVENAAAAYAGLITLDVLGTHVDDEAIRSGFAKAEWPGRFEIVQANPTIVLDAAHTPAASRRLAQALDDYFPEIPIVALLGISGDKNLDGLLAPMRDRLTQIVATQSGHPRAQDAAELAEAVQAHGIDAVGIADPAKALQKAKEMLGENSLLVVFGSVFLVERLGKLLQENQIEPD